MKSTLKALTNLLDGEYYQGMNFVTGIFFLFGLTDFQIFPLAKYFFSSLKVVDLYKNNFDYCYKISTCVEKMIKKNLKFLAKKLEEFDIILSTVIVKWLLTSFTEYLSIQEVSYPETNLLQLVQTLLYQLG